MRMWTMQPLIEAACRVCARGPPTRARDQVGKWGSGQVGKWASATRMRTSATRMWTMQPLIEAACRVCARGPPTRARDQVGKWGSGEVGKCDAHANKCDADVDHAAPYRGCM